MKKRALLFTAAALALVPCAAQIQLRVNNGGVLMLNGNVVAGDFSGDELKNGDEANSAAAQVLEFADGSRLHGVLTGLDGAKKEIVWRGVEASAPMTFPLSQVSQVELSGKAAAEIKVHATVKLTGGDWLAADVMGLREGKLQLKLNDGTALAVERARVEWVFFSKNAAPECYDGPQSLSGWASGGGWTYREGALRAAQPAKIGRYFDALPDQVEYRFEFDQGASYRAFAVLLHGAEAETRPFTTGMIRVMINDGTLQVWSQREDNLQQETVDLSKVLPVPKTADGSTPPRKATRWRIFEDRPGGRILVFIDGRKAADWHVAKGKPGENRGWFTFQPTAWSADAEQSLSKIRVMPWDGFIPVDDALEGVRPKTDQVVMADGESENGRIESVTADKVKLGAEWIAREKIAFLRFAKPEIPPEEDPAIARVRLAQRGEFEVAEMAMQEGKMRVRTNFGGELVLPVAGVRAVEFAHLTPVAGRPVDTLLFKNGDQLRGLLESASNGQKLRWRAAPGTPPVELETARVAGVLIAPRKAAPPPRGSVLARCRNGDFVAGDLVALDAEKITLESSAAGRVALPRTRVRALYFASEGRMPVLDGAAEHEVWEAGLDFNRANAALRKKKLAEGHPLPTPWAYFDGAFSVKRNAAARTGGNSNGNFNLGRIVEGLPARVEFSFDVSGRKGQIFFTASLFSEPENSGYMLQLHPAGLFIYDTSGRQRGAPMIQQQQVQFGDKVKADVPQHRLRVLADRTSGRVAIFVDDVLVTTFGPKAGAAPRNLGRGLALMPQQNMNCTFANLWVAPWDGKLPGQPVPEGAPADTVLLANGDEAQGVIGSATPENVQLESEVGTLDLPVARLIAVEFGGRATEAASGVRLRLSDRSVLTVSSYRIENENVVCQSDVAGEIKLPLSAVQELVFAPPAAPAPPKPEGKPAHAAPVGKAAQARGVGVVID